MKKSRKIIIFSYFILFFTLCCFMFSYGCDYYWHVKVGEWIFNNKAIPYTDIFGWYGSINKLHWISHEWLSEVIIFLFSSLFKNGAFIYTYTCVFILGTIIFLYNKNIFYKNSFIACIWSICGCLMFVSKVIPRPHLISYILFIITCYLATDLSKNENSNKFYLSLIIAILWSNCHGGSSNLSYFIYGVFLFFGLLPNKTIKKITNNKLSITQIKKFFVSIVLSIVGICINPHGLIMLIYPYLNMTYTNMTKYIAEWQSIQIFRIDGIFYIIFMLFVLIKLLRSKSKIRLRDLFLFAFFSIMLIKSMKFAPYLYIVTSFFIFDYKFIERNINIYIVLIFITILCLIIIFNYKAPNKKLVSDKLINYLKENNDKKIYNNYGVGGYLIYNDIKPYIDGRADMYIDTIFDISCTIENEHPERLRNYDFDLYIVLKDTKSWKYLKNHASYYKLVMNDKNYYIFENK